MKNIQIDLRIAAIAAKQHGNFSRAQALAAGASREAIRWRAANGTWIQLSRDVFRIAGAPDTWHARLWAAVLEAGPGAVVSHRSAAALLGIPGFGRGPVHVLRKGGRHHPIRLGTVHETFWLPPEHKRMLDGIPSTSLARTLCDLAADEHPLRTERAVENSLQRLGLTIPQLATVVHGLARSGRAGTTLMRGILSERLADGYVPTESELEDLFLAVLAARGVALPRRQVDLGDGQKWVGRVDFVYLDARLVAEVNGRRYHSALLDMEADAVRASELAAAGWRLIVVTYRQLVEDPDGVADRVRRALSVVPA